MKCKGTYCYFALTVCAFFVSCVPQEFRIKTYKKSRADSLLAVRNICGFYTLRFKDQATPNDDIRSDLFLKLDENGTFIREDFNVWGRRDDVDGLSTSYISSGMYQFYKNRLILNYSHNVGITDSAKRKNLIFFEHIYAITEKTYDNPDTLKVFVRNDTIRIGDLAKNKQSGIERVELWLARGINKNGFIYPKD